ncbi:MAG: glycosyltransferase family 4 protein [Lentisphaerae bacterium]|nr:glycosyltransferase family 4 protein [Lentisphaerota bacterium]
MKNILYIGKYNGIIGGIERYMQKSAVLLRQNGFAVHYRFIENGGKDQAAFAAAFDSVKPFLPGDGALKSADMVILHNIIEVKYLAELPPDKTCFFAHDHNIYCQRHHYYTPLGRKNCHRAYNRFICKLCSLGRNPAPPLAAYRKFPALVLSDFMQENLRKNGFEKVFKLPAFITPDDAVRSVMPDGVLRILFLGQLIRGKGADLMLKTLARLEVPFHCTIAGDGKDRDMLEKMVEKFNLRDKVCFAGFVSEPERLWADCDVFFFPIRWQEPFGLVGLEAMAHGVPVVAFDLGGVREYLDCGCGRLIAEKDIASAAGNLNWLGAHPELLAELGDRGRSVVKERFSEENFVDKFNNLAELLL